jgi:hypothetical protein
MNQANEQSMQQLTEILLQHYGWAGLTHDMSAVSNSGEPSEAEDNSPAPISHHTRPGRLYTAEHAGPNKGLKNQRSC